MNKIAITALSVLTAALLNACPQVGVPTSNGGTTPNGTPSETTPNNPAPVNPAPAPANPAPSPNTQNPDPAPAGINVRGKLLKFNGEPVFGVTVQIDDAQGNRHERPTDTTGAFSADGIVTPYTISVVPQNSLTPTTWEGVTRTDPTVVLSEIKGDTFSPPDACNGRSGRINVTLDQRVDGGNTGRVFFIAKGINHLELASNAEAPAIGANGSSTSVRFNFDRALCQPTVSGTLVYLERDDSNGQIENIGIATASVPSGETISKTITVRRAVEGELKFKAFVPQGVTSVVAHSVIEVGGAGLILEAKRFSADAFSSSIERSFSVPELAGGIRYRVLVADRNVQNGVGQDLRWAHSDALPLPLPDAPVELQLPNLSQTRNPAGAITQTTPTFSSNKVDNTNLYLSFVTGRNVNMTWLGASPDKDITLPDLPAPARIEAGTQFAPKNYTWRALNAAKVRGNAGPDGLLDGRMVGKVFFGPLAALNPSVIESGSFRAQSANFNVVLP